MTQPIAAKPTTVIEQPRAVVNNQGMAMFEVDVMSEIFELLATAQRSIGRGNLSRMTIEAVDVNGNVWKRTLGN